MMTTSALRPTSAGLAAATRLPRECLRHFRPNVAGVHFEALLEQRARYADAHRSQTDHAHRLFLPGRHLLTPRVECFSSLLNFSEFLVLTGNDEIEYCSLCRECFGDRRLSQQPSL